MGRIRSQNCGGRAWSKVILGQVQDLKTVRRYKRAYFDQNDISSELFNSLL